MDTDPLIDDPAVAEEDGVQLIDTVPLELHDADEDQVADTDASGDTDSDADADGDGVIEVEPEGERV